MLGLEWKGGAALKSTATSSSCRSTARRSAGELLRSWNRGTYSGDLILLPRSTPTEPRPLFDTATIQSHLGHGHQTIASSPALMVQTCNADMLHAKAVQSQTPQRHTRNQGSTARANRQASSGPGLHLCMEQLGKDATNVACTIVEGRRMSVDINGSLDSQSRCVEEAIAISPKSVHDSRRAQSRVEKHGRWMLTPPAASPHRYSASRLPAAPVGSPCRCNPSQYG